MATRHGCALSRELRSLPLLFLKSGKRIFKPEFRGAKFIRSMPANQLRRLQRPRPVATSAAGSCFPPFNTKKGQKFIDHEND